MVRYIILIFTVLGMFSLLGGCSGFCKKSSKIQDERLALLDQKILELEKVLSNLNTSAENLERQVEELSQKTVDIDANYSKLNVILEGFISKADMKDSSFETILSESQRSIDNLEKKLSEIEKAKTELQNQIAVLQEQRFGVKNSDIEHHNSVIKEEAGETIQQGDVIIKDTPRENESEGDKKTESLIAIQGKEELQKLLDEALIFYRNENYKEAINKWEEALAIDPENTEAKFNIEIATEKIKSLSEK